MSAPDDRASSDRPSSDWRALGPAAIARVFVPFAAAYFLSYVYRVVNAVIAPDLVADVGLGAEDLGLLSSVYFLTFAAFQLPLGVLLDRFGPRRVEAVLLLLAAAGAAVFAAGQGLGWLIVGRGLVGLGVSACLMAGMKAFVVWFPSERMALANGALLAAGGMGALAATAPAEWAVSLIGWRGLFFGLAAATLAAALLLVAVVPERRGGPASGTLGEQLSGLAGIAASRRFWRLAPLAGTVHASNLAIQGLWSGPWLRDVAGFDREAVAHTLFASAAAMVVGALTMGAVADRLERRGVPLIALVLTGASLSIGLTLLLALQVRVPGPLTLWIAFGATGGFGALYYAAMARAFAPALAGRVVTSINFLVFFGAFGAQYGIGWIIERFAPAPGGGYAPAGYQAAFLAVLALEAVAIVWFFAARPAREPRP